MDSDRIEVNGLWIGDRLSPLEILTIRSFLDHGYCFNLWVYNEVVNVPEGTVVNEASQIIPVEEVFSYQKRNRYGHGKGSYAGFSDVFRYKLLLEKGGWWTDMDVTCLGKLPVEEYFFRDHHQLMVVGNVMRCPKGSDLMRYCYERALSEVGSDNTDWHKPILILNDGVKKLGLQQFIQRQVGNLDDWRETKRYVLDCERIPTSWAFIHWQNEEWRSRGLNKWRVVETSVLADLMRKHKVDFEGYRRPNFADRLGNLLFGEFKNVT